MTFHLTRQFLNEIWYNNSYLEGNFWKGRKQLIVVRFHVESDDRAVTGYD